ncbi:hypothetical protein EDC04DRAFT_2670550 [Pisolithus marmoratus]|nr:hypothetical protein EDC04DRAFT_2670550 [Pisolithus marmoratus]
MADCGICLEALKKPVSVPCGHIHCEGCLRKHVISGDDALKSTCPTCRQEFYTAVPDLAVVPEKYHDFILPTIRKLYIDIPSVSKSAKRVNFLKSTVKDLSKEIGLLGERCDGYEREVQAFADVEHATRLEMRAMQNEYDELSNKYHALLAFFREPLQLDGSIYPQFDHASWSHRNINASSSTVPSHSSRNNDASIDLDNTLAGGGVAASGPLRPKRALPKSRSQCSAGHSDVVSKRQRVGRHSDIHDSR